MAKKGRNVTQVPGMLEIDHDRGVIYFHLTNSEDVDGIRTVTLLRICGLPKPIPKRSIDLTLMGESKGKVKVWLVDYATDTAGK